MGRGSFELHVCLEQSKAVALCNSAIGVEAEALRLQMRGERGAQVPPSPEKILALCSELNLRLRELDDSIVALEEWHEADRKEWTSKKGGKGGQEI